MPYDHTGCSAIKRITTPFPRSQYRHFWQLTVVYGFATISLDATIVNHYNKPMKIGLIGCGKVGTTLFYLLKKKNHIVGVYDRNKKNKKRALRLLSIKKNPSLEKLCMTSEALFFATPDDQITKAYGKVEPYITSKKYIYHFSGLLRSDIFPKSKGVFRGSVHPFATFPKINILPRRKYIVFIEGDNGALKAAKKIFPKKYFALKMLNKKEKEIYHLVGVFSSNFIVGLMSATQELAKQLKWGTKEIEDYISPIIEETLRNIESYGIKNALSGPLERGDIEVVKTHLKALSKNKNLQNIYKTLSLNILKNIVKGKKKQRIEKILR